MEEQGPCPEVGTGASDPREWFLVKECEDIFLESVSGNLDIEYLPERTLRLEVLASVISATSRTRIMKIEQRSLGR